MSQVAQGTRTLRLKSRLVENHLAEMFVQHWLGHFAVRSTPNYTHLEGSPYDAGAR